MNDLWRGNFSITLVNGPVAQFDFTARLVLTLDTTAGDHTVCVFKNAPMQFALRVPQPTQRRIKSDHVYYTEKAMHVLEISI